MSRLPCRSRCQPVRAMGAPPTRIAAQVEGDRRARRGQAGQRAGQRSAPARRRVPAGRGGGAAPRPRSARARKPSPASACSTSRAVDGVDHGRLAGDGGGAHRAHAGQPAAGAPRPARPRPRSTCPRTSKVWVCSFSQPGQAAAARSRASPPRRPRHPHRGARRAPPRRRGTCPCPPGCGCARPAGGSTSASRPGAPRPAGGRAAGGAGGSPRRARCRGRRPGPTRTARPRTARAGSACAWGRPAARRSRPARGRLPARPAPAAPAAPARRPRRPGAAGTSARLLICTDDTMEQRKRPCTHVARSSKGKRARARRHVQRETCGVARAPCD